MTYKFTEENNIDFKDLEVTDPTIEIIGLSVGNPKTFNHDYPNSRYSVWITLITENSRTTHALHNVQAESMNMEENGANIPLQVLNALNTQFAI